ncbi:LysM peptidoglycan-binding domain-containing protein [Candidatus Saccharibacteria bacterium]|nr:LysM peptidoglycan-binding domain-containing protein [Candidatus Saccharibacteria bacterium]
MKLTQGLVIIAAVALVVLSPLSAAAQSGSIGGRPANPDPNNPRSQSIFIYTLEAGEMANDQVRVSNNSQKDQTVELLAVDGIVTNTGDFTCKQNNEEKTGLSRTIELSRTSVELAAGASELIDFRVTMPEGSDVGEQNACLVFQSPQDEGETDGNIRIRTRQAIRVVATVPGELNRSVSIEKFEVSTNSSGQPSYEVSVKNQGNVSADVAINAQLQSVFGGAVSQVGGQYPVLANQSLEKIFTASDRPLFGGWYSASASISYDKQAGSFGVDNDAELITASSKKEVVYIAPTAKGAGVLALIGFMLSAVVIAGIYRLRHQRIVRTSWKNYTVKAGDTINSVAATHKLPWQKLARVNNIKAPYELRPADTLKVPDIMKK